MKLLLISVPHALPAICEDFDRYPDDDAPVSDEEHRQLTVVDRSMVTPPLARPRWHAVAVVPSRAASLFINESRNPKTGRAHAHPPSFQATRALLQTGTDSIEMLTHVGALVVS